MSTHNVCFEQKYEKYQNSHFLVVEFSLYLNRPIFVSILLCLPFYLSQTRCFVLSSFLIVSFVSAFMIVAIVTIYTLMLRIPQKNRNFIIQERYNKLIYGINTIIKCGT